MNIKQEIESNENLQSLKDEFGTLRENLIKVHLMFLIVIM